MGKLANTPSVAKGWVDFLAARPEVPWGQPLIDAFNVGKITRLCDCGCNSFDLAVPDKADVTPIVSTGGQGSIFEISFEASGAGPPGQAGSLEFVFFADARGHFAGIEVDFCGNSYPVPHPIAIADDLYYVSAGPAVDA